MSRKNIEELQARLKAQNDAVLKTKKRLAEHLRAEDRERTLLYGKAARELAKSNLQFADMLNAYFQTPAFTEKQRKLLDLNLENQTSENQQISEVQQ